MNAEEIIAAIDAAFKADSLTVSDLDSILRVTERVRQVATAKRERQIIEARPELLLPNWGLYDHGPAAEEAEQEIDAAGIELIKTIRGDERPSTQESIKAAYCEIKRLQEKHSKLGANDTEGREALWELIQNACKGTIYDARAMWKGLNE